MSESIPLPADSMGWRRIASAPRDGSHILGIIMDDSTDLGLHPVTGALVRTQAVIHWWDHPGERGFYTSVNEMAPEHPFPATHWRPLIAPPALLECGCVIGSGEWCKECY